ncbi:MAG: hypothetical protein HY552_06710 [Elusimicrobia bacterium]|nr:hypothetical protein [Elusimicrobiota bacterium]
MSWPLPRWAGPALALSLAAAVRLGAAWEALLAVPTADGVALFGQAAGAGGAPYQSVRKTATERSVHYGFVNFNRDRLTVSYRIPEKDFRRYNDAFGYRSEEVEALLRRRDRARAAALRARTSAQRDALLADAERAHDRDLRAYLGRRGFRLEAGGVTRADMPRIVRFSGPHLKPVALAIDQAAARRRYRSADTIGAALSLVQTSVRYREPDAVYKGKHTGGILLPLTALLLGWGDCDTKTGLLASILSNWPQMRMIGLAVPGHYLMAVLQIPERGDLYVEYDDLQYVLLEPAGPAQIPPGRVADATAALLDAPEGYRIDPFF